MHSYDEQRERLIDAPCRVIDFLPRRVPAESGTHYFPVERYLTERPRLDALYRRFARIALLLSCYETFALNAPPEEDWTEEPAPETLVSRIEGCAAGGYLTVLFPASDALLTLDGGDLYLSVYGGSGTVLDTVRQLAAAEGLFLRDA